MLKLSPAIHHHDIQISATLAESHQKPRINDASHCFLCVFIATERQGQRGDMCGATFVAVAARPYNLQSQENQNKLGCAALPVCHHYKSSSWPRTCTSTLYNNRAWENNVCSQEWSTTVGWYTVRRVPFTFTSHTLIVWWSETISQP